jgi:hypothetical protein
VKAHRVRIEKDVWQSNNLIMSTVASKEIDISYCGARNAVIVLTKYFA